ncbi:APH(3') family aminoglycoside O-phosphotransferase [Deinococcus irradiatisoli]|uniref:APH(3') family aminoglycoside O-phosphotransferase n=1 Tax=Deinococcus irradiatisoli TaxID=2202254 RepID=UPI001FE3EE78|nr:APH(3') family aminoglycoside O-phosphotransferase [Deinococcus irradiatisoli]
MSLNLPPELRRVLPAARWEDVSGESGAQVWQSQKYIVKVHDLARVAAGQLESLRAEQLRWRWLAGRLPAARVVGYASDAHREYLATTRLPGLPMHHPDALLHARRNADLLARALRELHALPIRDCPFSMSLAVRLRQARERVLAGAVDPQEFSEARRHLTPEQLLGWLVRNRQNEDLAVTHGDACLPNVLVSGEYVEGFVDVGRLGLADRHTDLALACRSLRRNCGDEMAEQFLDTYGRERVDPAKLEYYQTLDELF